MLSSEDEADDHWAGPGVWVSFVKYLNYLLYFSYMCLNCHVWTCVDFFLSSLVYTSTFRSIKLIQLQVWVLLCVHEACFPCI
jgi:hypothetical protein